MTLNRRLLWRIGLAFAGLSLAGFVAWMLGLPRAAPDASGAPAITQQEADATIAALKPPKRPRPLVAILGINDATETTDYLMPYGIVKRADVADVVALATQPGPVSLYPVLTVMPDASVADFDARHPQGADYVIVPAMSRDDDPAALQWIRAQADKGAIVIAVCAGAKVVAAAGLLDGKRGTTHWYYLDELLNEHPAIQHVRDRRFVVDRGVATTTGISASMPMSLTLIEAIAGRARAEAVAQQLGLAHWDARHASAAFKLTRAFALTSMANTLAFWNREQLGIELTPGIDEVSLALVADAWSRTYRSRAVTFAGTPDARTTRNGIRIVPDRVAASWPANRLLPAIGDRPPAVALEQALRGIDARHGSRTGDLVAMQLEYPRR
ncbi:MAG: DJ-1/PfpI family protein [Burkholderiaceae bacterium]|nr:DJ-1/PfpI family protein [Burkholderiaceae bacterium]